MKALIAATAAIVAACFVSGAASAQSPDIPTELKLQPAKLTKVAIKEKRPMLVRPTSGLQIESCDDCFILLAMRPGVYRIEAIANSNDPAKPPVANVCIVTVEGDIPPDPRPPSDPLLDELRSLYRADTSATKAADLLALAELYSLAAEITRKPEIATAGRLLETIRRASANLGADKLAAIRQRIGRELATVLPSDPAATMTDALRDTSARKFAELSAILKRVNQ
jgi:hypothetical protein